MINIRKITIAILIAFSAIISLSLTGCGTHKMNVNRGTFQVISQPTINGYGVELENNKTSKRVVAEYSYGNNTTKKLNDVKNRHVNTESDRDLPASNADISYRIIENNFDSKIELSKKWNYAITWIGAGFSLFPYVYVNAGINSKHFEFGAASLLGYSYNKASYTGVSAYWGNPTLGIGPGYGDDSVDYNGWQWHSYASEYIYASLMYSSIAIKYSASISYPMGLFNDLPISNESEEYDLSFQFPYILKQSIQFSYHTSSNVELSIGTAQITGQEFSGRDYQYNF